MSTASAATTVGVTPGGGGVMATQPKKRKAEEDPDQQWNCCCCGGVAMRPTPAERATLKYKCGAGCGGEACTNCAEDIVATPHVGRCKLDPSLKAPCFQPLHLRVVLTLVLLST